jgi:hypothetical protein
MIDAPEEIYYDDSIESVVKYRRAPRRLGFQFGSDSSGWTPLYNSITGLRLRVADTAIEVRGMGPFRRLGRLFGFELSLAPAETTMETIPLSRTPSVPGRFPGRRWTTSLLAATTVMARPTRSRSVRGMATLTALEMPYERPG